MIRASTNRRLLWAFSCLTLLATGCSQIASFRPQPGAAQVESGLRELQSGNAQRAETQFQTAVKLAGRDYRTAATIAAGCILLRNWDMAVRYGEAALKVAPKTDKTVRTVLYATLTTAYVGQGDRDKAIQLAIEGHAEDPQEPANMNLLGYTYAELAEVDKLPEALELTEKAVRLATEDGRAQEEIATYLDSVGWVKYQMGRTDEAIVDLGRAAFALPTIPDVNYHLGKAYMKKSRYADAVVVLERALKLAPAFKEAEVALKEATEKVATLDESSNSASGQAGSSPDSTGGSASPNGNTLPRPNP